VKNDFAPYPARPLGGVAGEDRSAIVHEVHKGDFWKPCPGTTKGYFCCGYQILTPLTGCGMYCRYCILQAYLENQCQIVFDNFSDLESEVRDKLSRCSGVVRFGTGEFGDSLFLENELHLSRKIAELLAPYPNVLVEFKTKSTNVDSLAAVQNPRNVVVGFSMNTPRMISTFEQGTALLEDRLAAAKRCLDMGFWVAFHFDPIFLYPEWKQEYRSVVARVFDAVSDTSRIAWWSLGGFRSSPALKALLRKTGEHLPLFAMGELVQGEDGKIRYYRPIRVEFYSMFREEIDRCDHAIPLYLCMESPEVWNEAGMMTRIPRGLATYLDERAEKMLGITINQLQFGGGSALSALSVGRAQSLGSSQPAETEPEHRMCGDHARSAPEGC
jgi:spore photoproduct lyase